MKNPALLLILFSLLFFQCKKDKQVDPCVTLICQHGGNCVDGSCECPKGWEGDLCQTQKEPTALKINKIIVEEFPTGDFDNLSNPDLYVAISKGELINNNEFTTGFYDDVTSGASYDFMGTELDDVNSFYTISLYDYDLNSSDDIMSGITFKPISFVQNFPVTIRLNNASIETNILLEIEWIFD